MVIDNIKNADKYFGLGIGIKKALQFIKENKFDSLNDGKYEIDGAEVYAMISRYESKPMEKGSWEAHRKYIDVQYVAGGIEKMGYAPLEKLTVSQEYKEEKDIMRLTGSGDFLTAKEGTFAIFYPTDGHMPGMAFDKQQNVLKVVVKVLVD